MQMLKAHVDFRKAIQDHIFYGTPLPKRPTPKEQFNKYFNQIPNEENS
jgi:hypothetical protein